MSKTSQIFKNVSELEPSMALERAVLSRISLERNRSLHRKLVLSYAGVFGSLIALAAAGLTFGQNILHSEFWSMFSLSFSDMSVVLQNWQEFLFSLLETFPTAGMIVILIPIFTLFVSFSEYLDLHNSPPHQLKFNSHK